jgi:SAM-dependent methyltransferase
VPVIDLGEQPWCNNFLRPQDVGDEPRYPLRVAFCRACGTAQLDFTVPKEVMFAEHTYLSGTTKSLSTHFESMARAVDKRFFGAGRKGRVLDIGSNDGTQLRHYQALGFEVLGVESAATPARLAEEAGVPTVRTFFNEAALPLLGGAFDVINASGVFFHLEELHSVTSAVQRALKSDGVFVVQFLYMPQIIANGAFDQIYHEHLLYYNLTTLNTLLTRHGLEIFDAMLTPIHGGQMVAFCAHRGARPITPALADLLADEERSGANTEGVYLAFADRIRRIREENLAYLESARKAGKRTLGLGAPAKGNTLLNYFGVDTRYLEALVERNHLRRGLVSPGMHIPVIMEEDVGPRPDGYYVLAWNYRREILERHAADVAAGTEFYFPVNVKD